MYGWPISFHGGQYSIVQYDYINWIASKNGTQNSFSGRGSDLTLFRFGVWTESGLCLFSFCQSGTNYLSALYLRTDTGTYHAVHYRLYKTGWMQGWQSTHRWGVDRERDREIPCSSKSQVTAFCIARFRINIILLPLL